MHILLHALKHTFFDTVSLLPFLFLTYLFMEFVEHMSEEKSKKLITKAGKLGPLFGGVLGAVPQCAFSSVMSGLYSARFITLGTLFAVFLSTSDEMLPVMISNKLPLSTILTVIAVKTVVGIAVGFVIDLFVNKKPSVESIGHMCEEEGCHCHDGLIRSAFFHTLKVFSFIFALAFLIEALIGFVGEDFLRSVISPSPVISNLICALIGLIPNCAASVVVTELYVEGFISVGSMMSGLLTSAGMGTLVLFRTNKNLKENAMIVLLLWLLGTLIGSVLDFTGFQNLL